MRSMEPALEDKGHSSKIPRREHRFRQLYSDRGLDISDFPVITGGGEYRCPRCDFRAKTISKACAHVFSEHLSIKPFKCGKCSFQAVYKWSLKRHANNCKARDNHGREMSGKVVKTRRIQSLGKAGPNKKVNIPRTGTVVEDYGAICEKHGIGQTPFFKRVERHYQCPHCPFADSNKESAYGHLFSKHLQIEPFSCETCSYRTSYRLGLANHVRGCHDSNNTMTNATEPKEDVFRTSLIDEAFRKLGVDQNDYLVKLDNRLLGCTKCGVKSKFRDNLSGHVFTKHLGGAKPFSCGECCFKTSYIKILSRHMNKSHVATDQKQLKIRETIKGKIDSKIEESKVDKTAENDRYIPIYKGLGKESYMPVRSRDGNWKCSSCDYESEVSFHVHQHIFIKHLQVRPLHCQDCGGDFAAPFMMNLSNHRKTCKGKSGKTEGSIGPETNFPGSGKSKQLSEINGTHIELESGRWKCVICDNSFKHRWLVTRHLMKKHGELKNKDKAANSVETCDKEPTSRPEPAGFDVIDECLQENNIDVSSLVSKGPDGIWKCINCGYKSDRKHQSRERALMHNFSKHLDVKPFKCGSCNSKFAWITSLASHQKTCDGEKSIEEKIDEEDIADMIWKCRKCEYTAAGLGEIKEHAKDKHHAGPRRRSNMTSWRRKHDANKLETFGNHLDQFVTKVGPNKWKCKMCPKSKAELPRPIYAHIVEAHLAPKVVLDHLVSQ